MNNLQRYQVLFDETEMLICRATQLEKEMQEIKMLYSYAPDDNLMKLFRKNKKQYDTITKQIVKNQQKLKKLDWR